jgi:hypothetical protein
MRAFISYSHKDSAALDKLHTHLAMLKREGKIIGWFDREILAGSDVDQEINSKLANSDLFLALVSPDFLASSYCYEREVAEAIVRHEAGTIRVVPIIIEPCDWKATPLQKFKALPRDGKPIAEWTNANTAYLDVVSELRRLTTDVQEVPPARPKQPMKDQKVEARRYRIKRDFDEIDRREFRVAAFNAICAYFQSAVEELNGIDGLRASFHLLDPTKFTCTVLNKSRQRGVGHITVFAGGRSIGDIAFNHEESGATNMSNGWFSIEADEYDLFFNGGAFSSVRGQKYTAQQISEHLWSALLERAGVTIHG